MANITPAPTLAYVRAEAERMTKIAGRHDEHAQAALLHAAFARRVVAAELLKRGQPMTAEAIAASVDVDLALVRVVLDALVTDREIVRQGCLFAWPRTAA